VGENGCWHSGIHIKRDIGQYIYPAVDGVLAAYRISQDYKYVPRLREITRDEYAGLQGHERELYEENPGRRTMYRMKDNLTDAQKQFENERYTDSFFLVKHTVKLPLPDVNSPPRELDFFILYTNIIPNMSIGADFSRLESGQGVIPFYQKHCFRVSPAPFHEYSYTVKNGKKIFAGSRCTVKHQDDTTYRCNFLNFNDTTLYIDVPKAEMTLLPGKPTYRPKDGNVPIYRTDMTLENALNEQERPTFQITTITTNAYFKSSVEDCYEGYFKVKVDRGDAKEITIDGKSQNPITERTEVIIKKSDLVWEADAYLNADNSICTEKASGVMVYDTPNGNARDILTAGREFELANPVQFLESWYKDKQYARMQADGEGTAEAYIFFEKRPGNSGGEEDLEVKMTYDERFSFNQTVVPEDPIPLTVDMPLGYPVRPPVYLSKYLEISLLFDNASFMEERHRLAAYVIPPGTTLYEERKGSEGSEFIPRSPESYQMIIKDALGTVRGRDGKDYAGFKYNGRLFYIPDRAAKSCKRNVLEWKDYFRILDTGYKKQSQTDNDAVRLFTEARNKVRNFFGAEEDNNGDIVYDGNPGWKRETAYDERRETRELKRTIVCCHPLEWDKTLYLDNESVRPEIVRRFGVWRDQERREYFKNQVKAMDIWEGLKGKRVEGLNLEANNFWFAHPIYFINHLYRAELYGLSRAEELERIQNMVIALRCLLINHKGIYPENYETEPVPSGQTYCNQAAFITIQAVDNKFTNFTGTGGEFPEPPNPDVYLYKNSNYWCDVLEKQAEKGIIVELKGADKEKEAQAKANEGYAVIAVWKNLKPKAEGGGSPHFATVRPGFENHSQNGPMLANVGLTNGVLRRSEGFPRISADKIRWYYNPDQEYQYKPEIIQKYKTYE
jgi:hypothetical protein